MNHHSGGANSSLTGIDFSFDLLLVLELTSLAGGGRWRGEGGDGKMN